MIAGDCGNVKRGVRSLPGKRNAPLICSGQHFSESVQSSGRYLLHDHTTATDLGLIESVKMGLLSENWFVRKRRCSMRIKFLLIATSTGLALASVGHAQTVTPPAKIEAMPHKQKVEKHPVMTHAAQPSNGTTERYLPGNHQTSRLAGQPYKDGEDQTTMRRNSAHAVESKTSPNGPQPVKQVRGAPIKGVGVSLGK